MRSDAVLTDKIKSPFLSCGEDIMLILDALFTKASIWSDYLTRLLTINEPNCLLQDGYIEKKVGEETKKYSYKDYIEKAYPLKTRVRNLIQDGYIRLNPKFKMTEYPDVKTYIVISQDNFLKSTNPAFRDYDINFDIVTYNDKWVLDNYRVRPLVIAGYIDGVLNQLTSKDSFSYKNFISRIRLTGIGTYDFNYCKEIVMNEDISMYTLSYRGVHLGEDIKEVTYDN